MSFAMAVTIDFKVGPLSGPGNFGRHNYVLSRLTVMLAVMLAGIILCQSLQQFLGTVLIDIFYSATPRRKILYPPPDRLKALYGQYECGHAFPDHLAAGML